MDSWVRLLRIQRVMSCVTDIAQTTGAADYSAFRVTFMPLLRDMEMRNA